jgi:hypothetical protein
MNFTHNSSFNYLKTQYIVSKELKREVKLTLSKPKSHKGRVEVAALPQGRSPDCPLNRRLGGPWNQSGHLGEEENLLPF